MKILIFQPRQLGDIIVGTAAAKQIKSKYPNSELTYITSCKVLTESNPYIDISIERHIKRRLEKIYFNLIKRFYDKAYFVLHWLPRENMFQDLMYSAGVDRKNYPLKLYLNQNDIEIANSYIQSKNLPSNLKTIAVQDDFEKKWNNNEFVKLKQYLKAKYNTIFIGENMMLNNKLLNMREAAAVTSLCDLFIGGISGNLHAAVAVGTPTIGISSVFNPEWDMPEYSQNEFIINPKKKHKTVEINKDKFCGHFAKSYFTKKYVYVEGGRYVQQECFGKSDKKPDLPKEKFYEVHTHPCRCSIDVNDVIREIEFFFEK